jgi:hypothetical protein
MIRPVIGERQRCWSRTFGAGWVTFTHGDAKAIWRLHLEGDDATVLTGLGVIEICVGTPAYAKVLQSKGHAPPLTAEQEHWCTLEFEEGDVLGLRDGAPPEATPAPPTDDAQLTLGGRP